MTLITCIYHVFAFVLPFPGASHLVEECLACHTKTGRIRRLDGLVADIDNPPDMNTII